MLRSTHREIRNLAYLLSIIALIAMAGGLIIYG